MQKIKHMLKSPRGVFAGILLALLSVPVLAHADIQITEIMYDLVGADAGREWIEVYNSGLDDVDLSTFRFLENNVNHRLRIYDPDSTGLTNVLRAGEYAVIADGPPKFLVDHPDFDGILFNSSFSLRDGGEELSIVDPDGEIIYSVHYLPEWGARGTGNSLQFNGEKWIPAVPTPGRENATVAVNEDEDSDDGASGDSNDTGGGSGTGGSTDTKSGDKNQSTHSGQNELSDYSIPVDLKIGSGRVRYGIVNSPIVFSAVSNSDAIKNDDDSDRRSRVFYEWSFGDSGYGRGDRSEHVYYQAGEYNLVLNAGFEGQEATTRNRVIIRQPKIEVGLTTRGKAVDILLENKSDFEVNFGLFFLGFQTLDENRQYQSTFRVFTIPQDTILDPGGITRIPFEFTGFSLNSELNGPPRVVLYYPNGQVASSTIMNGYDFLAQHSLDIDRLLLILQIVRGIAAPEKQPEIDSVFNAFKNRLIAQNRL